MKDPYLSLVCQNKINFYFPGTYMKIACLLNNHILYVSIISKNWLLLAISFLDYVLAWNPSIISATQATRHSTISTK